MRLYLVFFFISISFFTSQAQHFSTADGLFDQNRADTDLGLHKAKGAESFTVFSGAESPSRFNNGAVVTAFKGKLYVQWQTSLKDEDAPETKVVYAVSKNGKKWSDPINLALPNDTAYCTSGGWWVNGDTLLSFVNVWPIGKSPIIGYAYYSQSTDGVNWTTLKPVRMLDGSAMQGVVEQDHRFVSDGRILTSGHFHPGLMVNPIFTDRREGHSGWQKSKYSYIQSGDKASREIEPSWFLQKDGSVVMIFRDQKSSFYKLAAKSVDKGETWTETTLSDMPDSRSKQSAGNLPNGTAFMVHNPVLKKDRFPLAIVLSSDGKIFNRAFVLREGGADLPERKFEGKAKTLGYSYPKSFVDKKYIYVSYSENKENIVITRVPIKSLY